MKEKLLKIFAKISKKMSGKGLGKIPGAKQAYLFIYKKIKPAGITKIKVGSIRLFVNSDDLTGIGKMFILNEPLEETELKMFKKTVKKGMNVLDLGANIGYYTVIASKLVGNNGRVYAFEPVPENYKILLMNIKENKCRNVTAFNEAVSDKEGKIRFYLDKENLTSHSLSRKNVDSLAGAIEVNTITLDNFKKSIRKDIDIIKMDVEGAEGLILKKADGLLKKKELAVFMEFSPRSIKNTGVNPEYILNKLRKNKFIINEINEKTHQITRMQSNEELLKKEFSNLYCHKED